MLYYSSRFARLHLPVLLTNLRAILNAIPVVLHIRICDARLPAECGREVGLVALPVKALKAGQESYWLDQIARNREEYFAGHGETALEELAGSKALRADVRSVEAACRLGGAKRVKVETVERLCRKVLGVDPRELYGEGFDQAWQLRGKRVNARVQAFDHCFSSPKSVSLLAAASSP